MGVDYYNCANCDEIYNDYSRYGSCEGCDRSWCSSCMHDVSSFWYGDQIRCDLCFPTTPPIMTTEALLAFAVEKLNTTENALRNELLLQRADLYSKPQNTYECQSAATHPCNSSKCLFLGKETVDEAYDEYSTKLVRGLCCRTRWPEDRDEWCEECGKEKKLRK